MARVAWMSPRPPPVYVAQEAARNSVRHAIPPADIKLITDGPILDLSVVDNGRGLPAPTGSGYG